MPDAAATVVGIGASAGGLEAFRAFFSNMPADSGMAFVVVLHLPAHRKSMLPDILQRWTDMPVRGVEDGDLVEANTIYVPPPHVGAVLREGRLRLVPEPPNVPPDFRPIDGFFDTLAASYRDRAVGIVLSGTGSDGALGLKAIRACGGLTIAQRFDGADGDAAKHYKDMPAGAIATGAVDLVVPVQEMAGHLLRLRGADLETPVGDADAAAVEALRLRICAVLRARVGHDFANYKEKTFLRRVGRRMQVLGIDSLASYAEHLDGETNEPLMLFRDLLIRVTSFFRDTEAFDVIERVVIPRLFEGKQADDTVRVWVPGCSTGEEAYSLAILMREHMDTMRGPPRVQVFATDIDEPAIGTARMGRYPSVLLEGMPEKRLNRFFTPSDSGYLVGKEIRDVCTFSAHSLVRDPPFSRVHLVSCRNLLIYLDSELQAKVIPTFHYALLPHGLLILGISESTSRHEDLFEPIDKTARIFARRSVRTPKIDLTNREVRRLAHPERSAQVGSAPPPAGQRRKSAVSSGAPDRSSVSLRGLAHRAESMLSGLLGVAGAGGAAGLARELAATREELQSVREEQETAVEELRSANEELHSVNEELQSTNEELETSKEEIQSVNEELHTVNTQLQDKVDELDRVASDLRNLFDSTQIATVFLDRYLIVRSFTPAIAPLYNLIPSDVGRPLSDIAGQLRYDQLRDDTAHVLRTLAPFERQVTTLDGAKHYILRILPYRGSDSTVSGTLVTFVDVSTVVRAEQHQRLLVDELNHRVKNMLTVVISLATQTLRRSSDMDSFAESFLGRVHALAASYTLLSRENWVSIGLRDVIAEEVRPFVEDQRDRISMSGEDVQLVPAAALAFGMAIHELATNAVKYGSLSDKDGSVSIRWRVEPGSAGQDSRLSLDWVEQGGPPVSPPRQTGFGTMLIQRSLSHELGGDATMEYRLEGLQARLHGAMDRVSYNHAPKHAGV